LTYLEALVLGVVQGVFMFVPVSSTAHLVIAQHLLIGSGSDLPPPESPEMTLGQPVEQVGAVVRVHLGHDFGKFHPRRVFGERDLGVVAEIAEHIGLLVARQQVEDAPGLLGRQAVEEMRDIDRMLVDEKVAMRFHLSAVADRLGNKIVGHRPPPCSGRCMARGRRW
jgi:hypothetical protein